MDTSGYAWWHTAPIRPKEFLIIASWTASREQDEAQTLVSKDAKKNCGFGQLSCQNTGLGQNYSERKTFKKNFSLFFFLFITIYIPTWDHNFRISPYSKPYFFIRLSFLKRNFLIITLKNLSIKAPKGSRLIKCFFYPFWLYWAYKSTC